MLANNEYKFWQAVISLWMKTMTSNFNTLDYVLE